MGKPLVSVVIPTFNRANLVGKAITSAMKQCIKGDEIIVVDDGSTDKTLEAIAPFLKNIKYIAIPNSGAGAARNTGIHFAKNELIAFLDSDDEWMPNKLEIQRNIMQNKPDVLYCFSDFACRLSDGEEDHNYLIKWHNDHRPWDQILGRGVPYSTIADLPIGLAPFNIYEGDLYISELKANYIFTSTLMVRRKGTGEILTFGENVPIFEDWEYFGKLAKAGTGVYLECETAWQNAHTEGRLTDADAATCAATRIKIIRRVWGKDRDFINQHRDIYDNIINEQRLIAIRSLLSQGKTNEARWQMERTRSVPMTYKLLARSPGLLVKTMVSVRRLAKGEL